MTMTYEEWCSQNPELAEMERLECFFSHLVSPETEAPEEYQRYTELVDRMNHIRINGYGFHKSYCGLPDAIVLAELDDVVQLISKEDHAEWMQSSSEKKQFREIKEELTDRLKRNDAVSVFRYILGRELAKPELQYLDKWKNCSLPVLVKAYGLTMGAVRQMNFRYMDEVLKRITNE